MSNKLFENLEKAIASYCQRKNLDEKSFYIGLAAGGPIHEIQAKILLRYMKE